MHRLLRFHIITAEPAGELKHNCAVKIIMALGRECIRKGLPYLYYAIPPKALTLLYLQLKSRKLSQAYQVQVQNDRERFGPSKLYPHEGVLMDNLTYFYPPPLYDCYIINHQFLIILI
jgi:hypothetical protein